ncbi:hypothetical protein ASF11_15745 [Acidovorax sp. Leaf76]|nr:hypothetical protein ASF11_15745 [Acidovorax sp. Leaf76]KQO30937.1 hypothetical protein ASF19_13420 [Acidovorax sp. Leaf84]KQS27349.1 hypothetical protein ASG27_17560 [Acidovorax sp. Leaf191]
MQPRLLIKLLPLEADGLMDAMRVVLLFDLAPGAIPYGPAHVACLIPVRVHQRNGCAQVVRDEVSDGQRVGILGVSLCFLEELQ